MPLLSVKNLSKRFGKKKIFRSVSFDVNRGDILGLIGRSGCGKSTLLKILVGYLRADSGSIIYDRKDITKNFKQIRRLVGYTTQDNSFYDKLTVYENMRYYANLYGLKEKEARKRIEELLKSVELTESKKILAEKISGGMKRRLDFAISLIHNPDLIILDEPTAGLDQILVEQFWKIVKEVVKRQNKAVIISSHIIDEIHRNCTRVVIMHKGTTGKVLSIDRLKKQKNFSLNKYFKECTLK